jgi:acyl-coenzyme A thioesterase PaaI-like protein
MSAPWYSLAKANRLIWLFGITKIPLLALCRTKLVVFEPNRVVVKIRLGYFTKNHLGSMYFGAMAIGADLAAGLHAFFMAQQQGSKVSLVFKDFKADFLQRPYGDVFFEMQEGQRVAEMLSETQSTKERVTEAVTVVAYMNGKEGRVEVAKFELGLSLKAS